MRRMQRPLHRRLHRLPPVPPPRARLRRRMPPVPPPPRQASPRTPPRLLPLKPQRRHAHTDGPESITLPGPFLIGSATSRTGLASRRAWHENARHTSPTDPRHAQHVARPPHPSRASATQKHGTDRQQHGLFRHRQGHGRVTERPSFSSPTAPTHTYIRIRPLAKPCNRKVKRHLEASTGDAGGQIMANTDHPAASSCRKSLTKHNRPSPHKRQPAQKTLHSTLKAQCTYVIIFRKSSCLQNAKRDT